MGGLETLDWVVIGLYAAAVIGIGAWANRRQRTTEDYFLGGRRMPWWAVGVSLVATSFSSVALVGGTGEGFSRGMGYLQLQLGDLLGIGIAVALFLPFFARLGLTTAYEYLERRFGVWARTLASALFIGQTLMRAGVLVLVPGLALSNVLGIDLGLAIAMSGLAAVVYSSAGGITAVVWTDLIQFAVVVVGVAFCVGIAASDVPGGVSAILDHARAADQLTLGSTEVNFAKPYNVLWTLLAYGTLALSIAGANQQAVQRYLSCADVRGARRAAYLGWAIGFGAVALTLFLGVTLSAWRDLAANGSALKDAGDQALPLFIVHRLPAGLAGLLVAAIFAASMSSMDSAIHSMSTATLVDFVRRFRRRALAPTQELRLARVLTALFGLLATGLALYASRQETQVLQTLFTWLGYFAGPLLGLFLLGVLTRRTTEGGALAGALLAGLGVLACVLADVPGRYGFQRLWLAPMALVATFVLGWAFSGTSTPASEDREVGLTWWDRPES